VRVRLRYIFLCLIVSIALVFNIKNSVAQLPLENAINRLINEQMATQHIPGLALAVIQGDKILYTKGYGVASSSQPVTVQTQFFIASVSKSFTAAAVMQLVEAGKINLDAPVQTYLPEFTLSDPNTAARITIRHLLNQVSGLSDLGFPEYQLPQPATLKARVTSLNTARPVAVPGTQFHYFNPNYAILARVVEVVSQQPFSEYLRSHFFAPLQMTHTLNAITSTEASQTAINLAQGHLMAFGIPFAAPEMKGFLGGSGGMISTAEDIAHFLIMQTNKGRFEDTQLLSPESMTLMHAPPQNIHSFYGMGWFALKENGKPVLEHNGILSTFYTDVVLLPQDKYGIVLLYNISAMPLIAIALPQIKTGLIQLLTDGQPTSRGMSIDLWGISIGILTLIGVGLAIRSLLRLRHWKQARYGVPLWRSLLSLGGMFFPAVLLLALPWLLALQSGRVFSYAMLYRAMPDVMIWLSVCALLGVVNGTLYCYRGKCLRTL
jgi:CubicO group peptidase (beta-lactamase class C family)